MTIANNNTTKQPQQQQHPLQGMWPSSGQREEVGRWLKACMWTLFTHDVCFLVTFFHWHNWLPSFLKIAMHSKFGAQQTHPFVIGGCVHKLSTLCCTADSRGISCRSKSTAKMENQMLQTLHSMTESCFCCLDCIPCFQKSKRREMHRAS